MIFSETSTKLAVGSHTNHAWVGRLEPIDAGMTKHARCCARRDLSGRECQRHSIAEGAAFRFAAHHRSRISSLGAR